MMGMGHHLLVLFEFMVITALVTGGIAAMLSVAGRFGAVGRGVINLSTRAPLLDVWVALLTWVPWVVASICGGWSGLAGAFIGQIIGGFVFPRYAMPVVMQWLSNLFPLTYFIPISRGIYMKGIGMEFLTGQVIALAFYTVAILFFSARLFRQRLD